MASKPRFFATPSAWRAWLEENHAEAEELWVGLYKRDSGRPSITWPEAVDGALCFGWIDGLRKGVDAISYKIRFTPRKPGSIWSAINTRRVAELMSAGRMRPAGQKEFEQRDRKKTKLYSYERETAELAGEYERRFHGNEKAWEFYQAQPPGYRRVSTFWVMSAKREETRQRRLAQLIESSAKGRRIDMLTPGRKK